MKAFTQSSSSSSHIVSLWPTYSPQHILTTLYYCSKTSLEHPVAGWSACEQVYDPIWRNQMQHRTQ